MLVAWFESKQCLPFSVTSANHALRSLKAFKPTENLGSNSLLEIGLTCQSTISFGLLLYKEPLSTSAFLPEI